MSKPLYGCSNPSCAEEVSYPAVMLRVYEGKPYCDCCWDDAPLAYAPGVDPDDEDAEPLYWHDLEPFVPEHEKRIAELEFKVKLGDDFKERAHYVAKATQAAWEETVAELEAENARLRGTLHHITRMNDHNFRVSDIHDVAKAALLGGGK